jgi:hypothetical protein
MKDKKTIKAWAVLVADKIKSIHENEGEAKFSASLEKYMGYLGESKKGLRAHVKSVSIKRITITAED